MRVIVLDVLGQSGLGVTASKDVRPVVALAPNGADRPPTDRVGPGRSDGFCTIPMPSAAKTASKEAVNLGSAQKTEKIVRYAVCS